MTGAAAGAAAAAELDGPGVTDATAADWFGAEVLLLAISFFLQVGKLSAKNNGRNANRVSINEVKAFSLTREKNKRFLPPLQPFRAATRDGLSRHAIVDAPTRRQRESKISGAMAPFGY